MTIQLYGFWRSNAAFRVRVALALKEMPFDEIDIDLLSGQHFDPRYAELNAEHVVPTLVHEGERFAQSLAIIEYLDDIQPAPRLLPEDPRERARARALAMIVTADVHPLTVPRVRKHLAETFGAAPAAIESWCRHWTAQGLASYERILSRRPAAPFALGAEVSIADICVASQVALADVYGMDLSAYPEVTQLGKRCFEIPAFAKAHPFEQPGFKTTRAGR